MDREDDAIAIAKLQTEMANLQKTIEGLGIGVKELTTFMNKSKGMVLFGLLVGGVFGTLITALASFFAGFHRGG